MNQTTQPKVLQAKRLNQKDLFSIYYHDVFSYPLHFFELDKWKYVGEVKFTNKIDLVETYKGYIFPKGKKINVITRILRERVSVKKLQIAKKAAKMIGKVPNVLFVGITGSLAMMNAEEDSDIDLMIITRKDSLWLSRILVNIILSLNKFKLRRKNSGVQKDRLCLNIWLTQGRLTWTKKNIYTAHEICQIVPLLNRENTYEKFILKNSWAKRYWQGIVDFDKKSIKTQREKKQPLIKILLERVSYLLQKYYMRTSMTNEKISYEKALFHPNDWSRLILERINRGFNQ